MKKLLGYAFKASEETYETAIALYVGDGFPPTLARAVGSSELAKEIGDLGPDEKVTYFKVYIETVKHAKKKSS
jgi:hypothetical protein